MLRQFANGIDANNRRVHRAFLASVRVLGEGVDITGERGAEAICFAATRGSQVEIVQNIGRALRPNKDGTTKVARIIVPVFLQPGEDPQDMVASASFRPLIAVLQGLRSHDERLVEQLASLALTRGRTAPTPLPGPRCSTSPAHATRRPSRHSSVRGFTGRSPWGGWRATRPAFAGGPRTRSPGCTPSPMTPRPRSG